MKLWNILPVHNEDWVLELCVRALLMWCDGAVILLHACTDGSEEIARRLAKEYAGRIAILEDSNPKWDEMPQRHRMLEEARRQGATHIGLLDADEILTGNLLHDIRTHVERLVPRMVLELPGYNLRNGLDYFHSNGVWGNRWFSAAFCDDSRLGWDGDRFHHRHPMGPTVMKRYINQGQGGIMHLWGASERRLVAKHAMYKCSETLRWPNKSRADIDRLYSLAIHGQPGSNARVGGYGTPDSWNYCPVAPSWWEPYEPVFRYLDLEAVPSQELEVMRLLEEHGAERFKGLDLFGMEALCQLT